MFSRLEIVAFRRAEAAHLTNPVIPAKAGSHFLRCAFAFDPTLQLIKVWVPAFAGMTTCEVDSEFKTLSTVLLFRSVQRVKMLLELVISNPIVKLFPRLHRIDDVLLMSIAANRLIDVFRRLVHCAEG